MVNKHSEGLIVLSLVILVALTVMSIGGIEVHHLIHGVTQALDPSSR